MLAINVGNYYCNVELHPTWCQFLMSKWCHWATDQQQFRMHVQGMDEFFFQNPAFVCELMLYTIHPKCESVVNWLSTVGIGLYFLMSHIPTSPVMWGMRLLGSMETLLHIVSTRQWFGMMWHGMGQAICGSWWCGPWLQWLANDQCANWLQCLTIPQALLLGWQTALNAFFGSWKSEVHQQHFAQVADLDDNRK